MSVRLPKPLRRLYRLLRPRSHGAPVTRKVLRLIWAADAARGRADWVTAAEAYAEALAQAPMLPHLWVQYGHMLREAGRGEEARDAYERAVALDPHIRELYTLLITLARGAGDRSRMLTHALSLYRLDPEDVRTQATLLQVSSLGEPHHDEALGQLARQLGWPTPVGAAAASTGDVALYIDVGDLIGHFAKSRLPSGLQRVEIEVARAALAMAGPPLELCCWSIAAAAWKPLTGDAFLAIAEAAASAPDDAVWHRHLLSTLYDLSVAPPLVFPPGSTLLDLGMAWGDPTHQPAVAREKARSGLRFAAIACDVIPLVRPDDVPHDIASACADWLDGLAAVADRVIAISAATADDLVSVSVARGKAIPRNRIGVVPLDAPFERTVVGDTGVLASHSLRREGYVLYVSTVEPRKNHLAACEAWRILARTPGLVVPDLVCVGRMGWRSETVAAALAADPDLARRVHLLSGVSDQALGELYEGCAFAFYPSLSEGWGLPVTEALAYGKLPVVGDNSSLPEAGGEFAIYVNAASPADMAAVIGRLIRNPGELAGRERLIRDRFRPRGWAAVARDMIAIAMNDSDGSVVPGLDPVSSPPSPSP